MTRLKLPAYGKQLLAVLRAATFDDEVPLVVHLIYGERWREEPMCAWSCGGACHAKLCITPDDYAPGRFDFHLMGGLQVALFDQLAASLKHEDKVFDLISEIARWSADVQVHVDGDELPAGAHQIAHSRRDYRYMNDPSKNHGWPRWWSQEIELLNEQRRNAWFGAAAALAAPEEV